MSVVLVAIAVILMLLFVKWKIYVNKFASLPSPKGHPILGHYYLAADVEKVLDRSLELLKAHGKTYKVFLGPMPIIVTSDPNLIKIVLTDNTTTRKSDDYRFFNRWWGDGLLVSSGYKWKSHRKILTPAFHNDILEDFVEVFENNGKLLIQNMAKEMDKASTDISHIFSLYTLDVICETAMGTTVDAQTNPTNKYLSSAVELCGIIMWRSISVHHRLGFIYQFTKLYRREVELANYIKNFSLSIINRRRKALEKKKFEDVGVDEFGKRRKATFMDILLMSQIDGVRLSDEEVREEVDTFLFAGHDTAAIALGLIAYNLAINPEIQAKAYDEITAIFGDDINRTATMSDLNNMKYIENVIKESLRLYPSVPVLARQVIEDIKYDGIVIPKGITLVMCPYALHHDEDFYPDPEKFDPDRFNLENQLGRDSYTYIPFSSGFRNCIGQKFAMLEMKSAISKVLKNFELIPASEKPRLLPIITIKSLNGVQIRLKKRL